MKNYMLLLLTVLLLSCLNVTAQCPFTEKDMCESCEGDGFYRIVGNYASNNVVIAEFAPGYIVIGTREPVTLNSQIHLRTGSVAEFKYAAYVSINEIEGTVIIHVYDVDYNAEGDAILTLTPISFKNVCGLSVEIVE